MKGKSKGRYTETNPRKALTATLTQLFVKWKNAKSGKYLFLKEGFT